jgi:succinate dehydrogenase / fumarate reductase cytochrome b subunit
MYRLIHLFNTSIGSKLVVAVTGAMLLGFLLGHAAGNLLILKGADSLNAYAHWLQGHPLLWGFRLGLLALFGLHITATVRLARQNRTARPIRYERIARLGARLPGRLMLLSGGLLLLFLVLHLLHLTVGAVGPDFSQMIDESGRVDVYRRVVVSFSDPLISGLYLFAMAMLAFHLVHAVESLFQTLGFNHESYQTLIRFLAWALTAIVVAGFSAVPLLVLTGVIGPDQAGGVAG